MTGTLTAPLWFALIFLVPTLFLFQGKWSFIIPGYNMMPPSEKRKFKVEKLCRAMAWMMLTMTLGFTATGVAGYLAETGRAELEAGGYGQVRVPAGGGAPRQLHLVVL